jgi:ATP-dependent DNA helicase RecG
VIDEMPPNRRPVVTKLFRHNQKELLYKIIRSELKKGRQVYIVYPTIEESEKLRLRSAVSEKEEIEKIFHEFRVGLIHGRMKPSERDDTMRAFKAKEIDILVCTTVIEVGVDVPNASVMVIEHAERFGLAQLHQLRGRVGRGPYQSYCFLVAYGRLTEEARKRLEVMVKYNDGFRIAEEDFRIRGPGELFGTRQSGMPDLKVADLLRHTKILSMARQEAFRIVNEDEQIKRWPVLKRMIERFWRGKIEIFRTS